MSSFLALLLHVLWPSLFTKDFASIKNRIRLLSTVTGVACTHICKILISQYLNSCTRLSPSSITCTPEEEQQNTRQVDFINPNNVFMDITNEQGADLNIAQIVPTVQYLTKDDNLNYGTGRLSYAIGNAQNFPPEMQPRGSSTSLYFSL